jgi:hypothetical protein
VTLRFPRTFVRTALIHLLASGAISAWALNLTLDPPSGPLPAGTKWTAVAKDDKGAAHPCT